MKRAIVGIVLWVVAWSAMGAEATNSPIQLGANRHLFIDDALIESSAGAVLTVNSPEVKELVIIADRPWERNGLPSYGTALRDPQTGEDLMFYFAVDAGMAWSLCLAVSTDGVNWDKPNLGLVEWEGSRDNNIIDFGGAGTVMLDPNAPPERRFANLARRLSTSPDGRNWTTHPDVIVNDDNLLDAQMGSFWDDERGQYVHLARYNNHDGSHVPRQVRRHATQSLDEVWPAGETLPVVMSGDEIDPPALDLYTNAATKYPLAPGTYLAFPTPYYHYNYPDRRYLNRPALDNGGKQNDGVIETQLAVSRDGATWKRYRTPYLPLMTADGLDLKIVMALCGLIYREKTIDQYFGGYTFTHGDTQARYQKEGRELGGIWRVEQRLDGFVSLDFDTDGGEALTRPFVFQGDRLALNINTSAAGECRVAICDETGREIEPYTIDNCRFINGDYLEKEIVWNNASESISDVSPLANQSIRLRFTSRRAKLYAFQFFDE